MSLRYFMKKLVTTIALASTIAVGSASIALAGQPAGASDQGAAVKAVAQAADYASGKARGEAVSALAKQHGALISSEAKTTGDDASAAGQANAADAAAAGLAAAAAAGANRH
jgi:hypothetical protein